MKGGRERERAREREREEVPLALRATRPRTVGYARGGRVKKKGRSGSVRGETPGDEASEEGTYLRLMEFRITQL